MKTVRTAPFNSSPCNRRSSLMSLAAIALSTLLWQQIASADLASHYYVGSYSAGIKHGTLTVELVEALPGGSGYIGWITVDGLSYLGNIYPTADTVEILWYWPNGSYQYPLGAIQGTISPDGTKIDGSFRQGIRTGRCRLQAF